MFRRNDAAVITVLLDGGANPDLTYRGLDGVTALHLAADNGNVGGVVALLDHEADPNALDDRGRTPLATAARTLVDRWGRIGYHANATVVIRELLARGAKGTVPNEYGWGSLHVASLLGKDSHSIADLIKRGHDPDGKTSTGWTALHMAALVNKGPGVIAALLDGGADTDARFGNGRTPMHCAAFANRDPQLIGALVEAGADPSARTTIGWTPLHAAAYGNPNPEIVEALLEAGASTDSRLADSWAGEVHFPNSRSSMDAPSLVTLDGRWQMINGRSTPLHVGAGHARSPAIVAALLNGGADPDARDVERETPLFSAMAGLLADRIDFAVVGALLDAGADPNALNANDQTPLHKAVSFGLLEAASALLDSGADPNAGPTSGWTPLHNAATRPSVELTSLLLRAGADANGRAKRRTFFHIPGDTPLHAAADSKSDFGVIDALLRGGADPNARNVEGRTALFSAAAPSLGGSNDAVVRRLIDGGADPNIRDRRGETPLIAALTQDDVDPLVVSALLDGGADASLSDQEGLTPWDLAERHALLKGTELYWRLNNARFD